MLIIKSQMEQQKKIIEWSDNKDYIKRIEDYLQIPNIQAASKTIQNKCLMRSIALSNLINNQGDGFWQKQNLHIISKVIVRWNIVEKMDISNNFQTQILKQISNINFPNLIKINLKRNSIKSIEKIHQINWPNLKILNLAQNDITSINSLRKLSTLNKLVQINLQGNYITEAKSLTELGSKVKGIQMDYYFNRINIIQGSWIAKFQSKDLQIVKIQSPNHIINEKTLKVLKQSRKNPQICIIYKKQ